MDTSRLGEPLWSLMLSTNDCYPGCGCDDDWFDMSPIRIQEWVNNQSPDALIALEQLNTLVKAESFDLGTISQQLNKGFRNIEDARSWFQSWHSLLERAINAPLGTIDNLKNAKLLAEKFRTRKR